MENEVDLAPVGPDLSSTPNLGPGSSPLYPGQGAGLFGSNRLMIKPTAEVNPLDNAERLLTAERDKLQGAASRPIVQFLWHDEAKMMADEAAQKSLQIQGIQEKRQQQQTNQALARNMGLTRGMSPTAGPGDITEEALREWRENGNYDAYRGLHGAGQGARADLYMDEGVNALGKQTEAAQKAVGQLNSATNQAEYNSIRSQVLKHPEFSSLGVNETNLPKYQTEWKEKRGSVTAKLNQAQQVVETFNQKQASLSQAVPITDEKVAKAVTDNLTGFEGAPLPNLKAVSMPGAGGAQGGLAQPGSKDLAHFGPDGWNNATPENVKVFNEELTAAVPKQDREKYVAFNRIYEGATHDSKGNALPADKINTNPNIQQGIAEGLASTLRGGAGGANVGLLKIELAKRGWAQTAVDGIISNIAGTGAVTGKEREYLSSLTQKQVRDVMDFIKGYSDKDMSARMAGAVNRAGTFGIGLDKLGLEPDLQDAAKGFWQAGVEKTRLKYDEYPAIIKGDRRVILPQDAQVPGMIPAGSYAKGLPKAGERGTGSSRPLGLPAAPVAPGPPSPAGGGGSPAIPPAIAQNPVAMTVYGAAGQTGATGSGGNPTVARNAAIIATSSAKSESAFNPDQTHDGGIGYGLFGHNQDRLESMRKFAGTKPGEPIAPDVQAAFFVKELGQAAERDPFIRKVMNDPNASAADLTRVQMHMERPKGYTPGSPESGHNWQGRLANTQELMQPGGTALTAKQAEENYYTAASQVPKKLANIAPAIGAAGGMLAGGPSGALLGGAAGGAVRQATLGGPGYVDQMARGALEAIPAAIPGIGPARIAARVVAGGAVPAAEKLYDSGGEDTSGAIESGAAGAAGGILGEAFGRALGMGMHKIFTRLAPIHQGEVETASKVLATQEPKVVGAGGKMVDNATYLKAEQTVKDVGIDPEHAAYAYNVSKAGLPKGEAVTQRPSAVEAAKVGKEYSGINNDMTDAATTMSKNITPRNVQGGPTSLVRDANNPGGTVPAKYSRDAEDAQLRVTAPAKTWDAKWNQLGDARSDLLKKERDALASTANDKTERAQAMRALADAVRVQQEKVALHVLGPVNGKVAIARLEAADMRYRNAMVASGDGDIVKAIAQGGAEGRKAQAAFDALAANDPAAQRMVRSLVEMSKSKIERAGVAGATALSAYGLLHVPVVGAPAAATLTVLKAQQMLRDYMTKRGAGAPVKFSDMIARESRKGYAARAGSVIGSNVGNQMAQ